MTEWIESAESIAFPCPTLGELRVGFLSGRHRERNERELKAFLSNDAVEIVPIDAHTAEIYAQIVVQLRDVGTPIPTTDIWIAACAARTGSSVLTYDAHFESVARVGKIVLDHPSSE